jgi:hypothetical protein
MMSQEVSLFSLPSNQYDYENQPLQRIFSVINILV